VGTVMDLDVKCSNCGYKEKTDVVVDITNFFSEED
jgi:C4-type Zn-finger protein